MIQNFPIFSQGRIWLVKPEGNQTCPKFSPQLFSPVLGTEIVVSREVVLEGMLLDTGGMDLITVSFSRRKTDVMYAVIWDTDSLSPVFRRYFAIHGHNVQNVHLPSSQKNKMSWCISVRTWPAHSSTWAEPVMFEVGGQEPRKPYWLQ